MAAQAAAANDAKRAKVDQDQAKLGIVTHSGTFHADEALAVYLLRRLPAFRDLPLTRTRDASLIDRATIVVDVGATYEPQRHRYDHHQRGFEETFDQHHKTKLSSAGLVWKHFGAEIVASHLSAPREDERVALLWNKLYDDFVEAIDAIDNGIPLYPASSLASPDVQPAYTSRTDLSSRVGYLNPRWNEKLDDDARARARDLDARFERASRLAGEEFWSRLEYSVEAWLPARQLVLEALERRTEVAGGDPRGRIVVFDEYVSWKDHLFKLEPLLGIGAKYDDDASSSSAAPPVLYVVYPDESQKWRVQAVPETASSFASRRALPEGWRGVRDAELSKVAGVEGCVFVHASGFIGGNETKAGALEMARKALE